jgi:hypothetical protein
MSALEFEAPDRFVFWLDCALVMLPAVLPTHTETISERVVIHATVADFLVLLINFILQGVSANLSHLRIGCGI